MARETGARTPRWAWAVFVFVLTVGAAAGWVGYARRGGVWQLILAVSLTLSAATWFVQWRRVVRDRRDA